MNKLNNKGLTLIELIISVSLVSIVLVFLTRLLSNVTYESDNEFFASKNQEERIEIVDYIHNLIRRADITSKPETRISGSLVNITLTQTTYGKIIIGVSKNSIQVSNSTSLLRAWDLQTGFIQIDKVACSESATVLGSTSGYTPWICKIPIYTINDENNVDNNNTLDDLTLAFLIKG